MIYCTETMATILNFFDHSPDCGAMGAVSSFLCWAIGKLTAIYGLQVVLAVRQSLIESRNENFQVQVSVFLSASVNVTKILHVRLRFFDIRLFSGRTVPKRELLFPHSS
jgi:hypothetical protein